jgi:indole-3-glycerol phosphate synthase
MILDDLAAGARKRVELVKQKVSLREIQERAKKMADTALSPAVPPFPFEKALAKPGISFICEVKKASPSKGVIAEGKPGSSGFPCLEIAREYEEAGASAISVLTEPEYFLGRDEYLKEIAAEVKLPVLRKDFTVDPYQIYEARVLGASAVLLICALLDSETLALYLDIAHSLGLSALVEAHTEAETEQAANAGARIIGVNNRDLKTFKVDLGVTARLRRLIPAGVLSVSESGIRGPEDIRLLKEQNIDAVLIGETLMRATDKKRTLAELRAAGL